MSELNDYDGLKSLLDDPNISLDELDTLTDQERAIIMQIINEYQSDGCSKALKSIWYEDYDEVPVDIDTFIDDPHYFGQVVGGTIYPYWRNMLREIFAPGAKYFEVIFSCLVGDTEVLLADKSVMTIHDIVKYLDSHTSIDVLSYDVNTDQYVAAKCVRGVMSGCRTTYEVNLSNGKSFRATGDHKILINHDWKRVYDLSVGDYLSDNLSIVSIVYRAELIPVYDIEVETTHNFCLDCGIVVSNCSIGGTTRSYYLEGSND